MQNKFGTETNASLKKKGFLYWIKTFFLSCFLTLPVFVFAKGVEEKSDAIGIESVKTVGSLLNNIIARVQNSEGNRLAESATNAAWVQAVGTIVALGIAIFIPYWQHEKQRKREQEKEETEIQNMLCALRDEITIFRDAFMKAIGKKVLEKPDGPIYMLFIGEQYPFHCYARIQYDFAKIKDNLLRKQITATYGSVEQMFYVLKEHRKIADEYLSERTYAMRRGQEGNIALEKELNKAVAETSVMLRDWIREINKQIDLLLEMLPKADLIS